MPEQSEHHQQDDVDGQQRIIEKGEQSEFLGYFPEYTQYIEEIEQRRNNILSRIKEGICNLVHSTDFDVFETRKEAAQYIENYFNLGSEITEYLHTSSDSEDGLIYNDVVKLHTKYPILEILGLYANDGNSEKEITKYVFEYNIYRLLDFDSSNPSKPNKPFAIYYHFASNQIEGMQFVEPKSTGVECAYSMKNILGRAFNIPSGNVPQIQINDYTFRIVYRTKDNVRIDTTRPDFIIPSVIVISTSNKNEL